MYEKILLLQGPIGPFFRRLAKEFEQSGHQVFKINFNGGDQLFHPGGIAYRQCESSFREYVKDFLQTHDVTQVYLYGDCRPLHRIAIAVANELLVPVHVFEEGYIRPDYITCELGGVNGNSGLPKNPADYSDFPHDDAAPKPRRVGYVMHRMIFFTMLYYFAALCRKKYFHSYQHHRPFMSLREWLSWTAKLFLKPVRLYRDRKFRHLPTGPQPYFFVPLQLSNDAQVRHHSSFAESLTFIRHVVVSFANHAPNNHLLVIKQHPMAPVGDAEFKCAIDTARQCGVDHRVITLHETHLPSLLKRAKGVVTINSTVGLSGILHRAPVHCMGHAIYDMPGLTHQGTLEAFWQAPGKVDHQLFLDFRHYLEHTVLANGSFYKKLRNTGPSGLAWPPANLLYYLQPAAETPHEAVSNNKAPVYARQKSETATEI